LPTHMIDCCVRCSEVKLKKEHVNQNTGERGQPPLVEPITQAKVEQIEKQNQPEDVVVVSSNK